MRTLVATTLMWLAACAPLGDGGMIGSVVTLGPGGSLSFAHTSAGVVALFAAQPEGGSGRDVLYCEGQLALKDRSCVQLNDVVGEALDNGENSPVLRVGPDGTLFAVWIARDPRHRLANAVRFSRRPPDTPDWEKPRTLNDDTAPTTHDFPNAVVDADGTLHVFWLDRREVPKDAFPPYPTGGVPGPHSLLPGTVALYAATSRDGGATFETNRRVAGDVCACCRPAAAKLREKVVVAYRSVTSASVRNIVLVSSVNGGRSWDDPRIISNDGWKLNACPHSGPALALSGDALLIAWMDGSGGSENVYTTRSLDGGTTFEPRVLASADCVSADHPVLAAPGKGIVLAHECSAGRDSAAAVYRLLSPTLEPSRVIHRRLRASRPSVVAIPNGVVAGWIEDGSAKTTSWAAGSLKGVDH